MFRKQIELRTIAKYIKCLPEDIQNIIYILALVNNEKVWYLSHKEKYSHCIDNFSVNIKGYIDRKSTGYWVGSPTNIQRSYGVIHSIPKYNNTNTLCSRLVRKDEDLILKVQFTQDIKHKFNLSDLHEFRNVAGYFWFHEKCRCSHCDKIKIACIKSKTKFYRTERKEYGHLEKKNGFTFGMSLGGKVHGLETKSSSIGGHTFIKNVDNHLKNNFHKQFKNIEFGENDIWHSREKYLDRIWRTFGV